MTEHVHLIGIGGTGLSAIARVLLENGYAVSGSDRSLSPLAQSLQQAGVRVEIGHRPENILGADLVVRSSAIPDDNPEVVAALAAGIPVLKRSDFLGRLMAGRDGIAVAGTHGKTTTTAMIAWMLTAMGLDPSYIVGGVLKNTNNNARAGKGPAFVIEADEYDRMFLGLKPKIIVVTNIEHDHPDCFPTLDEYQQAFKEFAACLKSGGTLIGCLDDPGVAGLLHWAQTTGLDTVSYAITVLGDYQARDLRLNRYGGFSFAVYQRQNGSKGVYVLDIDLKVPGEHNVLNSLASLIVANRLQLPLADAARVLGDYLGAGRRFDLRGTACGITVIDDYAHHPTEIRAALAAARSRYPGRSLWAVWQPHTYSRTKALYDDFANAFNAASRVIVTEVYAAREPVEDFSAASIVNSMDHPGARFIPAIPQVVDYLEKKLRPGDVLLILSAGDADQIGVQILERLQQKEGKNG